MPDSQVPQQDDITIQIHHQDYILSQHKQDDAMLDPQVPCQQDNIIISSLAIQEEYNHQQNYQRQQNYNNGYCKSPYQQSDIKIIFILTYSFLLLDIEFKRQFEESEELKRQEKLRHMRHRANIQGAGTCCVCILNILSTLPK